MECRNCGKPLEDGLRVCPYCGTVAEELREMTGDSAWEG
ncbi:MAG: zinc-ribbon domain-containing protein, partial [Lachnospiraceae bacterium]|nr:zinc-ribbon domain-containing protein [Lachnospiraceae bacterium]